MIDGLSTPDRQRPSNTPAQEGQKMNFLGTFRNGIPSHIRILAQQTYHV